MAVVTHAGSTWNTTGGSTTVTATPEVDDLIVVVAASSGLAGGTTAVTDNQGGTYDQVDSDRTGFSTTGVLTVWVRRAKVASAVSTIYTAAQVGSTGGGLVVLRVAGMFQTGAGAVRSNGGQSTGTAATTPAPVLSALPKSTNSIISAVANGSNPAAMTPRASYAETEPTGYNTPTTGLSVTSLNSGETTATITWGGTSATAFASVAIELNADWPTAYGSGRDRSPGMPGEWKRRRLPYTVRGEVSVAVDASITPATETDAAQALTFTHVHYRTIAQATETDSARALDVDKYVTFGRAGPMPSEPVLDDFNRADENPLTTGWHQWATDPELKLVSNEIASTVAGFGGSIFDTTGLTPDVEAFFDFANTPTSWVGLYVRFDEFTYGNPWNAWYEASATEVSLYYGTSELVASKTISALGAGDGLGIRCVGSVIQVWVKDGGVWSQQIAVNDSRNDGTAVNGDVAVFIEGTTTRLDNFGAGVLTPIEVESAQALTFTKTIYKTITVATEADTAQALVVTKTIYKTLTVATETDAAQALDVSVELDVEPTAYGSGRDRYQGIPYDHLRGRPQPREQGPADQNHYVSITVATEADTARPLTVTKTIYKTLTKATEADSARSLDVDKHVTLTKGTELDAAKLLVIGHVLTKATEVDSAQQLVVTNNVTLTKATEVDSAQQLVVGRVLGVATETDLALPLTYSQAGVYTIAAALETDAAQALSYFVAHELEPALETDTALALSFEIDRCSHLDLVPLADDLLSLAVLADSTLTLETVYYDTSTFPSTGILDNFNRANEGPPITGWTGINNGLKIVSGRAMNYVDSASRSYLNTPMSGPDVEAYVELSVIDDRTPGLYGWVGVYARMGAGLWYSVWYHQVDGWSVEGGVPYTYFSTPQTPVLSEDDAIGIRCVGSTIEAWARVSGVWQLVDSIVDTSIAGTGAQNLLGLSVWGTSEVDNFGGGVVVMLPLTSSVSLTPLSDNALSLTPVAAQELVLTEQC